MQGRLQLPIWPPTAGPHLVWAAQQSSRRLLNAQHIFPLHLAQSLLGGRTKQISTRPRFSSLAYLGWPCLVLFSTFAVLSKFGPEALNSLEGHQTTTSVLGSLNSNIQIFHLNCKGFRNLSYSEFNFRVCCEHLHYASKPHQQNGLKLSLILNVWRQTLKCENESLIQVALLKRSALKYRKNKYILLTFQSRMCNSLKREN